jgi:hypothetical protein
VGYLSVVSTEAPLSPRFDDLFLGVSAAALTLILVVGTLVLWRAFDAASLLGCCRCQSDGSRRVVSFVLFDFALLALLLAALFTLVEARVPLVRVPLVTGQSARRRSEGSDPGSLPVDLTKIVDAFSGRKASTVLFAMAFTFAIIASAASGLVNGGTGR